MAIDISRVNTQGITINNGNQSGIGRTVDTGRTEATAGTGSTGTMDFSNLKEGQTFTGQVTNITPEDVTIALDNGGTLTARYDAKAELTIGDGARFKVISNENGTIVLKSLSNISSIDSAVDKALMAADLPYTPKNEELINALLKNEFPVNRQMINNILSQAYKNPDISMKNLVLMNKLGMEITPENTRMFENYANGRGELVGGINDSFKDMLSMIDGLLSDGNTDVASEFANSLLTTLNTGREPDEMVLAFLENDTNKPLTIPTNVGSFADYLSQIFENAENGGKPTLLDLNFAGLDNAVTEEENTGVNSLSKDVNNIIDENNGEQNIETADPADGPAKASRNLAEITADTRLSEVFSREERLQIFAIFENSDNTDAESLQKLINGNMSMKELSDLINTLPESATNDRLPDILNKFVSGISGDTTANEEVAGMLPKEATLKQAADSISTLLKSGNLTKSQTAALLHSRDFSQTLRALMETNWTLSASELNKDSLKSLYERVNRQSADIAKAAAKASAEGWINSNLKQDMGQMNENLNFMQAMNELMNYAQVPLRMSGQNVTGDLYVYTKKGRRRMTADGGVSCLLHLDMSNLGAMNVRIELKGANVSTKFYLDDNESANLITSHLHELDEAIAKQGYVANSEVVKKNDRKDEHAKQGGQLDFVKDFVEREMPEGRFSRYSSDMRA